MVEVWLLENAVTIAATLYLALINWTRYSRAQAKLEFPASAALRLLREHNYKCAQDDLFLNAFILCLGLGMVGWAMSWGDSPVPLGIVVGTGLFTGGWCLWSFRGWQSWRRIGEITKLVEARG